MLAYLLQITAEEYREDITRLYENYERLVWTTTGRFFHEEDRRWEAFQRSWLRVVQYAEKIFSIPAGKLPGYLVIIVKNVCRTMLTEGGRELQMPEDPAEWELLMAEQRADPEALLEQRSEAERARELIRDLPEPVCAVLEMRLVLGRRNQEVAKALGITEKRASDYFISGKQTLKRLLEKEGMGCE